MGNDTGWKELNDRLFALGSWLYSEDNSRFDLKALFDSSSDQYRNMPVGQRKLILKELLFCGVDALFIANLDLGAPLDQLDMLNNTFQSASDDESSNLDIHYPLNWFSGRPAGYFYERTGRDKLDGTFSCMNIIFELEVITQKLYRRLLDQPDVLVRKRLLYLIHSLNYPTHCSFPNDEYEPQLNSVEDKLLERIDAFPPETREEYGVIELQAEDIRDELYPDYRDKKAKLVRDLHDAIERMDMKSLENLALSFYGARVIPREDQGPLTKEWLYSRVWNIAIRREMSKLRGVKLDLKPLSKYRLR
ncbi:MAG: hypothetical protein EOM45_11255 [Clostridia bacterium]|nr:hypothetical protein [Clostridia bacterium]